MSYFYKRYKGIITDVSYNIIAYALPTFALSFVIQPVIARYLTGEENGLFLTILGIIRYSTNILITPLATLRLLEKSRCADNNQIELKFNHIYAIVTLIGIVITGLIVFIYSDFSDLISLVLSLVFLVLLFFHDYYSIMFRLIIDFKKIMIDNAIIVFGFFVGLGLFIIFRHWQIIFIMGYLAGSVYVYIQSWKTMQIGRTNRIKTPEINKKYIELSATNTLGSSITYCDKLLIYPILGGFNVSVYNAAGVVSKVITIISFPIKNVLLSYLVDKKELIISRKIYRRIVLITPFIMLLFLLLFSLFGIVLCKFLYPMFYEEAMKFIPIVVGAVVIKTVSGAVNLVLLQFAKTYIQTLLSAINLVLYSILVFLFTFVFQKALWGFCWSTFLTAFVDLVIVIVLTRRYIRIEE